MFWRGCQYCILCVQNNKSRKTVFCLGMNKFSETPTMMEDIAALFWNLFRWALKNFMLQFQRNILRKRFSPKNHVLDLLRTLGRKFSPKNHVFDLLRTLGRKYFTFLDELFRRGYQNCILRVWRINLKNFVEKLIFHSFILFRILSENVLAFHRKTFSGKIKT